MGSIGSSSTNSSVDAHRRASLSVVRAASSIEDPSRARVTSKDHVALQFYWQGIDSYVHCKARESVAPCYFNAHCNGRDDDSEFIHIVPVDEVRERSILDDMRVQLVSASSGKYLRATRVSKFLRWSSARDEQTVFQIQVLDHKPLLHSAKFTLASCFWPGYSVGFAQSAPLGGGSRALATAIGFLTLERKKNQPPLLFPLRLRAVLREFRDLRPPSPQHQSLQSYRHQSLQSYRHQSPPSFSLRQSIALSSSPPPPQPQQQQSLVSESVQHMSQQPTTRAHATLLVAASDIEFIEDDVQEELAERFPLATVVPPSPHALPHSQIEPPALLARMRPEDDDDVDHAHWQLRNDACPYCSVVFQHAAHLRAHIRESHGEWLRQPAVAGSFCPHCGQRRVHGACAHCPP